MAERIAILDGYNQYIGDLFAGEDDTLRQTRDHMAASGLPSIQVSSSQGKLLHLLVKMCQARRILEIGTLGGYSATWLARALPADGHLVSLELDTRHAEVARHNVARAGLAGKVDIRVGPAGAALAQLADANSAPFDLVFIDADKDGYVEYLERSLPLLRTGGWLLADNTLPTAVLDEQATSGAKRYNAAVAAHPELDSIVIPLLRDGGIDGLTISIKRG